MDDVKVKLNDTPSEQTKKLSTDGIESITDSLGRTLKIKPLDILYESRLTRALGAEASMNMPYMLGFVFLPLLYLKLMVKY